MGRFSFLSGILLLVIAAVTAHAQLLGEAGISFPERAQAAFAIPAGQAVQRFHPADYFSTTREFDRSGSIATTRGAAATTLSRDAVLNGPYAIALTVLDDKTLRPVAAYTIHGDLVAEATVLKPEVVNGQEGEPQLAQQRVATGHLESQRVKNAEGVCRYERLGRMTAEFEVHAPGYLPKKQEAQIPGGGASAIIRLTPAGALKGRLVDAATGEGVRGWKILVTYSGITKYLHHESQYETVTDAAGRFLVENLPRDSYQINFPDPAVSLNGLKGRAGAQANRAGHASPTAPFDNQACLKAYYEKLGQPCLVPPRLGWLEVREGAVLDLGTLRLERAPTLELEIDDEGGTPLAGFPFEVGFFKGTNVLTNEKLKTDDAGRARLALAGWNEGLEGIVWAQSDLGATYVEKKIIARQPDPLATYSDRDWYRILGNYRTLPTDPVGWRAVLMSIYSSINTPNRPGVEEWRYNGLTPQDREEFLNKLEAFKPAFLKYAAENPLPDHPNYELFTPRAGQVSRVRLNYKPVESDLDLMLRFIDKRTRAPVAGFQGVVGLKGNETPSILESGAYAVYDRASDDTLRMFQSAGGSGQAVVPSLFTSKTRQAAPRTSSDETTVVMIEKDWPVRLIVEAPGYCRQMFDVPLEQARAGQELTFELEGAARVKGRVALLNGAPLTSATIKKLLTDVGRWDRSAEEEWARRRTFTIDFKDEVAEEKKSPEDAEPHRITSFKITIGGDGGFERDGLPPGGQWRYEIRAGLLPRNYQENLGLRPGLNDLGEIRLGLAGWLRGKIVDERGRGLDGVALEFPLEGIEVGSRQTTQTAGGGEYQLSLLPFDHDRQLVRLRPPWGRDLETTGTPRMRLKTYYETFAALSRCSSNTLDARLDRGAPLVVKIPQSKRWTELAEYYADPNHYQLTPITGIDVDRPYFAIRRLTLQSLEATSRGLSFCQTCEFLDEGLRPTTGPLELRLDHVPPGRYAATLDGALMDAGKTGDRVVKINGPDYENIPLAYAELALPATSATLTLEISPADVELTMPGQPAEFNRETINNGGPGPLVFFDRVGAVSSSHGGPLQREAIRESMSKYTDPESLFTALPGYTGLFFGRTESSQNGTTDHEFRYRPRVLFHAVAPGTYRMRIFAGFDDTLKKTPRPYLDQTVEVTSASRPLRLEVPFQKF